MADYLRFTFIIADPGDGAPYDELFDTLLRLGAEDIEHENYVSENKHTGGGPKPKKSIKFNCPACAPEACSC